MVVADILLRQVATVLDSHRKVVVVDQVEAVEVLHLLVVYRLGFVLRLR